ncbi:YbaY family lipoprotein [Alcanivorax sp. 24]|uniref:YbaY family lipoprotein n=1 Tax=Alcanivorax sp. 24 TaxID=2545266 RepID=UPI001060327E|nr:YbaY family lipoprotein [Alcanivorax sp. 24]
MKTTLSLAALTVAALLTACDQGPANDSRSAEQGGGAMEQEEQQVTLKGEVLYRERIALPPDVTVRVVLEDVSLADAAARVIAEQTLEPETQVPIPFELTYMRGDVNPDMGMGYAVRAEIRDQQGNLLWTTTERHTVEVGESNDQPVTVIVHRVPGDEAPRENPENMEGVEGAGLSPAAQKVREQGAQFWAAGNEPGWSLAIFPQVKLELVTDYGETTVAAPDPGPREEGGKTLYQTSNEDTDLTVEIEQSLCQDDMSGKEYPYTVVVRYGDTTLNGCGQEL